MSQETGSSKFEQYDGFCTMEDMVHVSCTHSPDRAGDVVVYNDDLDPLGAADVRIIVRKGTPPQILLRLIHKIADHAFGASDSDDDVTAERTPRPVPSSCGSAVPY